jgi:hypothetical protein
MADKLDWLGKHLILLRYLTVAEAVEKEGFKIRPDLEPDFAGVSAAEEIAFKLAKAAKYKEACEFLPYVAHRRAGVWWVYRCVLSLLEELEANPAEDRDIADIATSFEPEIPDFAKVPLPKPVDMGPMDATLADLKAKTAEMRKLADPKVMKMVDDGIAVAFAEFKKANGIHPVELVKKLSSRLAQDPYPIDPASPVFAARAELHAKLHALRDETVAAIKSVLPPKVPAHEKKLRDNAMNAVYRWIAVPDEVNSKICLDVGNECAGTPAGLLSLSAFWAFGNLMPGGEMTVPTPPGLAANGLCQVLLLCALHKGGTRKIPERYELYFNLGVDVFSGKDNWEDSLAAGKAPHEIPKVNNGKDGSGKDSNGNGKDGNGKDGNGGYRRWKPEVPAL